MEPDEIDDSAGRFDGDMTEPPTRKGFFTDTSICIGCKACEVACKEWNGVPASDLALTGMSYDNSVGLGASTWRHVAFIEQSPPAPPEHDGGWTLQELVVPETADAGFAAPPGPGDLSFRWLMESDVCKHCTRAGCLDVCPTGALFRTEFATVVVQDDICNGCGYCVPACPYGVIERRDSPAGDHGVGLAQKCTLCYDRLRGGLEPACAKACPTDSIQFGDLGELRTRAKDRVDHLVESGVPGAQLYGEDPNDGVGGAGAFFLLLDQPEVYGLPPDPVVPSRDAPQMWRQAGVAALSLLATTAAIFARAGRR